MLRQGTGSADEYTVKFNTLIEETNIKEDASRLRYYMKGITRPSYIMSTPYPIPDTLALWQEKASCMTINGVKPTVRLPERCK